MKNYFIYKSYYGGCGYPKITLEGKLEDYIKLKEKLMKLKKQREEMKEKQRIERIEKNNKQNNFVV